MSDDFMSPFDPFYEEEEEDYDEQEAVLENLYYSAKQYTKEDPDQAVQEFLKVIENEEPKGTWGFKSLKNLVKLSFRTGNYDKVFLVFLMQ